MVNSSTWGGCSWSGASAYFTEAVGWSTVAHECGHNLFNLDDEYDEQDQTFTGVSLRANTTEALADWTTIKWSALLAPGAPLPTSETDPPAGWNRRTSVGAFEGAGGEYALGLFRPVLECRMNQNDPPWCSVCRRKIVEDLETYE
jgi:hypothetical protein